jgi:hypothetical protein
MDEATYRHLDKQLRRHRNQVWAGRINGPMVIFVGFLCFILAFDDATPFWGKVASAAVGLLAVVCGLAAFRLQFKPLPRHLAEFQEYQKRNPRKIRRFI